MIFFKTFKPALILMIAFTILFGIGYPLIVFGIGQLCFRHQANGSLYYYKNNQIMGSELIGQNFTQDKYFHPRPSNAGPNGYDASNSSGSNLGPTSLKLEEAIAQKSKDYRVKNKLNDSQPIPADAIMSSGSGLDPHISVKNALIQVPRIAKARKCSENDIETLIEKYKHTPLFSTHKQSYINVLHINLALDKRDQNED